MSLRIDAAYCALLGVSVMVAAPLVTDALATPEPVLITVGAVTAAWAAVLCWLLAKVSLTVALRVVAGANLVAAAGLAIVSTVAATMPLAVALVALAVDIGVFAASQVAALVRSRRAR